MSYVWVVLGMGVPEGSWTDVSGLKLKGGNCWVERMMKEERRVAGTVWRQGLTNSQGRWYTWVTCQV